MNKQGFLVASMMVRLLGAAPVAFAKNPNPGVIPPHASFGSEGFDARQNVLC